MVLGCKLDGTIVGVSEGIAEGARVGEEEGIKDGAPVVGITVGEAVDGAMVGTLEGHPPRAEALPRKAEEDTRAEAGRPETQLRLGSWEKAYACTDCKLLGAANDTLVRPGMLWKAPSPMDLMPAGRAAVVRADEKKLKFPIEVTVEGKEKDFRETVR
jgi:hypothetical protein